MHSNWTELNLIQCDDDRVQHLSDFTVQLCDKLQTDKKISLQWFSCNYSPSILIGLNAIKCRYVGYISDLGFGLLTWKNPCRFFFSTSLNFLIDYVMNGVFWYASCAHTLQHNQWPLTVKFLLSFSRPVIGWTLLLNLLPKHPENRSPYTVCNSSIFCACIHFKFRT